jgi:Protein of unknown function (DUF3179)
VMHDVETGSQWSHILGEAKLGKLQGTRLEQIPSVVADWQSWSRLHCRGTVAFLPRGPLDFTRKVYEQRSDYVLGIAENGRSRAWSLVELSNTPVINDIWEGQPILVVFDPAQAVARAYGRSVKDRELTFLLKDGQLQDRETGTAWEILTGVAKTGPLAGEQLSLLPAIVSDRKIWRNFFPDAQPPDNRR